MSYLYDKQGEADPDLKALEERLGSARYVKNPAGRRRWPYAVGAALAAGLAIFALMPPGPSMSVTTRAGVSQLKVGRWLETPETATIAVADIGYVTVEPSSRVRIVETSAQRHRLELETGRLHVAVSAPPRLFVVDTPSSSAVDLGCEYVLAVEGAGLTRLSVTKGEVMLEGAGVASRVSTGAECVSSRGHAPSVPRVLNASPELSAALDGFEQRGALEPVLVAAQARDAISLWNLLPRVDAKQRAAVLARLVELIGKPRGLDEAKVLALEPSALEVLWQSFP